MVLVLKGLLGKWEFQNPVSVCANFADIGGNHNGGQISPPFVCVLLKICKLC